MDGSTDGRTDRQTANGNVSEGYGHKQDDAGSAVYVRHTAALSRIDVRAGCKSMPGPTG